MKQQRGMMLIEIIFSLGLLATVAVLSLSLLDRKEGMQQRIENQTLALQIARSEMEHIHTSGISGGRLSSRNQQMLRYLPQGSGAVETSAFEGGLKQVRVTVRWLPSGTKPQHIELTTLVR